MKRNYVTPVIVMETFNVTQNVSACGIKINYTSGECVMADGDSTGDMLDMAYSGYFLDSKCSLLPTGTDVGDGTCYHTSVQKAFTS